jgi:5-methylcytosine-specific restriction endonuclease McrA
VTKLRDYKAATAYENQPEQVAHRVARNRARQAALKAGTVHKGDHKEVDHKTPMKNGGSNDASNLRVISEHKNTAWRKGSTGYKVKKA